MLRSLGLIQEPMKDQLKSLVRECVNLYFIKATLLFSEKNVWRGPHRRIKNN